MKTIFKTISYSGFADYSQYNSNYGNMSIIYTILSVLASLFQVLGYSLVLYGVLNKMKSMQFLITTMFLISESYFLGALNVILVSNSSFLSLLQIKTFKSFIESLPFITIILNWFAFLPFFGLIQVFSYKSREALNINDHNDAYLLNDNENMLIPKNIFSSCFSNSMIPIELIFILQTPFILCLFYTPLAKSFGIVLGIVSVIFLLFSIVTKISAVIGTKNKTHSFSIPGFICLIVSNVLNCLALIVSKCHWSTCIIPMFASIQLIVYTTIDFWADMRVYRDAPVPLFFTEKSDDSQFTDSYMDIPQQID